MAKSNKRKKATVDTELAVDILSEELKTEQLRGNPQNLEDGNLFVEDTQPDDACIHLPARHKKRARGSKQKRMTRAEAIITANNPLPLAPGSTRSKRSKHTVSLSKSACRISVRDNGTEDAAVRKDVWSAVDTTSDWYRGHIAVTRPSCTDVKHRPQIPAVEVDPPGCSYNPDHELHQDVIAHTVAAEYAKQIDKELQPKAPPLAVTEDEVALQHMEIGIFESDSEEAGSGGGMDGEDSTNSAVLQSQRGHLRKTVKDRLRQQRRKQMEKQQLCRRKLKQSRRDLDDLHNLQLEMDGQEQVQAARRARRQADVRERDAQQPPKLGRLKYIPQPTQVLSTEDVTGSLRGLKTLPVIAKDRFNSMQKRGLIHVTVKQHWVKPSTRRVKRFEKKATQDRHERSQREIKQLTKRRQSMKSS